jgi:2-polyprenyl-3-methyl-5-hydroxy-6-metoxy-1,4-benzoquinol methylase
VKNIYQNLYSEEKNSGNLRESLRIKIMLSMADGLNLKEKNILDIGCHDGTFLSFVKNRENNFFGLEANEWGVKESQRKGINATKYFFNDADKLPYADNFFDVAVAGEIIEHIFDTDFFLEEIGRVLKPKGKIIMSTPNIASLGRRIFLLLGRDPMIEISPNEPESVGHIRYFTKKSLGRLLRKHNFKILEEKSDCVNFSRNGGMKSRFLSRIFPSLGGSIIVMAEK